MNNRRKPGTKRKRKTTRVSPPHSASCRRYDAFLHSFDSRHRIHSRTEATSRRLALGRDVQAAQRRSCSARGTDDVDRPADAVLSDGGTAVGCRCACPPEAVTPGPASHLPARRGSSRAYPQARCTSRARRSFWQRRRNCRAACTWWHASVAAAAASSSPFDSSCSRCGGCSARSAPAARGAAGGEGRSEGPSKVTAKFDISNQRIKLMLTQCFTRTRGQSRPVLHCTQSHLCFPPHLPFKPCMRANAFKGVRGKKRN